MDAVTPPDQLADSMSAAQEDHDALFNRLKGQCQRDYDKQSKWRKDAREDFDFEVGEQLTEDDKSLLQSMNRPIVIMNRIGPVIDSVAGSEVSNRQTVNYIPREQGDVQVNEVLTAAAKWFRDQCDAEDEESDAFRDTVVCGMGWTETRLDYEDDPAGAPQVERTDPLEMVWDSTARKRNLVDMRRVFHIKRDIPIDEARALCPGDPDNPFEDADYDARWVDGKSKDGEPNHVDNQTYDKDESGEGSDSDKTVTMVRAQWWERVDVYRVVDPTNPAELISLDKAQFDELQKKAKIAGFPVRFVKQKQKVFRQAYLGNVLLEVGDAPCKDHFSFKCITGKRDRNRNTFFGLVRAMKDPQRWANKWMMQTMHIMNTSAKGGIGVERGSFFEDDSEGESSWAKNDQVTFLKQGALSGSPKYMQKPTSQFPQSSYQLMDFAISSIRDCSGVNVEILGLQSGASQAASLDLQRKQSSMTILQPLFDSLRRYRKDQGRMMLYLIQNYLSDGRLIRIVGKDQEQYVPLVKQEGSATYDVIVDESPSSPNQKEATWAMLQQILPVIGKMLPPATWLALMKYSPLPTSAQKDISDSLEQQQKSDPAADQFKAEQERENAKTSSEIDRANKKAEADIAIANRKAQADEAIRMRQEQTKALSSALSAPTLLGPDGMPIQGAGSGNETAVMMMTMMQQMQEAMQMLAQSISAPKRVIRDANGDIVGTAPAGAA